jgi:hypothetical protein
VCGLSSARGAKGEEEYPKHWLGGTGEVSSVGKWELHGVMIHQLRVGNQATICFLYFCIVYCSRIYALDLHV